MTVSERNVLVLQGTEIEATLWRDVADQWYEAIGEGKVTSQRHAAVHPPISARWILCQVLRTGHSLLNAFKMPQILCGQDQYKVLLPQVYLISKGKVKPANKAYTSSRNDYAIDLGNE